MNNLMLAQLMKDLQVGFGLVVHFPCALLMMYYIYLIYIIYRNGDLDLDLWNENNLYRYACKMNYISVVCFSAQ